jgi:hypothetical protein
LFYGSSSIVDTSVSDEELDVGKTEGVVGVVGVFARSEEEEKGDDDHIRGSAENSVGGLRSLRQRGNATDDGDRYRLDAIGRRVGRFPGLQCALQTEVNLVCGVVTWVVGPHLKERLCNVPYVIFSRSSPDGTAVGCKFSDMNSVDKDL